MYLIYYSSINFLNKKNKNFYLEKIKKIRGIIDY